MVRILKILQSFRNLDIQFIIMTLIDGDHSSSFGIADVNSLIIFLLETMLSEPF